MKFSTRFFLATSALLLIALIILAVGMDFDPSALGIGIATLASLLILIFLATRLLERGLDARTQATIERARSTFHTQLLEAQREAEDLQTLFDGLDDGLALIDTDDHVVLRNPAFDRWAGRPVSSPARIGSLFRTPHISEAVHRAQRGESVFDEVLLGESTVLAAARPHRDGALLMLRDLTDLRKLESVRRDFVANVSHELKTPLTSITGFAEALTDSELPAERAEDFGGRILANATRMRELVDDLLDLALAESGKRAHRPEGISLSDVAREVWEAVATEPERGTLEISDEGVLAYADLDAVRQILRNLLDNARRHGGNDGRVRLIAIPQGAVVRIAVTDEGPGIPSAHLNRVFERFYRVDPARARERGGTGLGLSIVKHLVEQQGGEVGMKSELGLGTTAWFTLPIVPEPSFPSA